jgi:glucose dehydrogenase
MTLSLQNSLYLLGAGLFLLVGVFVLRFILKIAWRVVRAALILLSLVLLAGVLFGIVEIGLR